MHRRQNAPLTHPPPFFFACQMITRFIKSHILVTQECEEYFKSKHTVIGFLNFLIFFPLYSVIVRINFPGILKHVIKDIHKTVYVSEQILTRALDLRAHARIPTRSCDYQRRVSRYFCIFLKHLNIV